MATKTKAIKNNQYWTMFEDVSFPDRINALPDTQLLTSAEAAVFLDVAPVTLERWVTDNHGPVPRRIGRGKTAPRMYLKQDLLEYQKEVGSPSGALPLDMRKIRHFTSVADLTLQQPYYLDEFDRVAGLVARQPLGVVIEHLGAWNIVWLNAIEASSRSWSNLSDHRKFAREVSKILNQSKRSISSGLEGTEIAQDLEVPRGDSNEIGLKQRTKKRLPPF